MSFMPTTLTLEQLRALPVPNFGQRDPVAIKAQLIAKFEAISGRKMYPSQTESFVIDLMTYALANVGEAIQTGLLQNLAIFAEGEHLDRIGANVDTYRLLAQFARSEVMFSLAEAHHQAVIVPKGTRISAGPELVFRTDAELVIPAGEVAAPVAVTAVGAGVAFNDLQIGQVDDLLDPIAYVESVSNTQITAGGSERERDGAFRARVLNAFELVTRGGSQQAYRVLVKAVHPDIVDVEVTRPQPGHIHIYPLMNSGAAPQAIADAILAYLDPETMIPMGDYVTIHEAVSQVFDVNMTIRVAPGYLASVEAEKEQRLRAKFDEWGQVLGSQVSPSALIEAARAMAGVVGVDGPDFEFTDLPSTHFAVIGNFNVSVVEAPNV
ncbi:baseplate J/gp47 family protein [Tropicibacter sp. R15_0]|uniref:baseplate J/gp47 family protein n=1 Tax=Tropicibacter sp. R15_0 TaxID=2821101 RepID=UPI001AD9B2BC|nr:baseplate J/gp47 family protein [Tropicibacter sp. R15_0]MBO9465488.1 baseplate J/gp47 family protein [Tropicibacter sp. R15_0]